MLSPASVWYTQDSRNTEEFYCSSRSCSSSNTYPILHQACYAQAPTSSLLRSGSYIKPVILRLQHMSHPTSSRLCSGPYIITPVLHQACNAQALTSSLLCSGSNICSTYFKPVMIRPLHHHPSPISSLFCPGSYIKHVMLRLQHMFHPTSSLLSSGPYIMPLMLRPQHMSLWRLRTFYCSHLTYLVPSRALEMLNTPYCSSAQACYVQAPTTSPLVLHHACLLRPQHKCSEDGSSLLCSGSTHINPQHTFLNLVPYRVRHHSHP